MCFWSNTLGDVQLDRIVKYELDGGDAQQMMGQAAAGCESKDRAAYGGYGKRSLVRSETRQQRVYIIVSIILSRTHTRLIMSPNTNMHRLASRAGRQERGEAMRMSREVAADRSKQRMLAAQQMMLTRRWRGRDREESSKCSTSNRRVRTCSTVPISSSILQLLYSCYHPSIIHPNHIRSQIAYKCLLQLMIIIIIIIIVYKSMLQQLCLSILTYLSIYLPFYILGWHFAYIINGHMGWLVFICEQSHTFMIFANVQLFSLIKCNSCNLFIFLSFHSYFITHVAITQAIKTCYVFYPFLILLAFPYHYIYCRQYSQSIPIPSLPICQPSPFLFQYQQTTLIAHLLGKSGKSDSVRPLSTLLPNHITLPYQHYLLHHTLATASKKSINNSTSINSSYTQLLTSL